MILAPREDHDGILREALAPLAARLRDDPHLRALTFVRENKPEWQVRLRASGDPGWLTCRFRPALIESLQSGARIPEGSIRIDDAIVSGAPETLAGPLDELSEPLHFHDTLACLDLITAESHGSLGRTRREYSLLMTERFFDLMRLEGEDRLAAYRRGFQWAIDLGRWTEEEIATLDERYVSLRAGIAALWEAAARDPHEAWGGEPAANIALRSLASQKPHVERILEALGAGSLPIDRSALACEVAHLHANRLGIEATPEAILRYFAYRNHQESGIPS